jgi:hypothetical protein
MYRVLGVHQKVGAGESSLLILLVLCLCGAKRPLKKTRFTLPRAGFASNVLRRVLLVLQQLPGQTPYFLVDPISAPLLPLPR